MAAEGIELQRLGTGQSVGKDLTRVGSAPQDPRRNSSEEVGDADGTGPPPGHVAHGEVQRWNHPRGNVPKLAFAFLSFIIAGLNDAAVASMAPRPFDGLTDGLRADRRQLEQYYDLNYTIVSLVFLTPFAGYSVAAFTNARIHMKYGQRGVAVMAPLCHIITYAVVATHPPFPVIVVIYAISGFGNGLTDACYCAWVGDMDKANQVQGFMHACYSLGALFAPLIATSMVVKAGLPWYTFYYIMIAISVLEWVGLTITFWHKTGAVYRAEHPRQDGAQGAGTKDALKSKVTWMCALFFFTYMGVEVGLGGWVVTFMLRVREAGRLRVRHLGSGFWAGMSPAAASGFVTERFGERLCISIYLVCCIALQLLFWLVPRFEVSRRRRRLPRLLPRAHVPRRRHRHPKLLPKDIHVSALSFAMAWAAPAHRLPVCHWCHCGEGACSAAAIISRSSSSSPACGLPFPGSRNARRECTSTDRGGLSVGFLCTSQAWSSYNTAFDSEVFLRQASCIQHSEDGDFNNDDLKMMI
ncbi:conserved hypothetical protein [Verticillium alfalfae VaMs.102]|uniref:Major facilitator superfamily (MFS) profile domain-containing protein n=1 Tax=Verticillium alfalfae (strain VaMs.102 / ATCC MYA-4576 / FGSC 10136) TaxID=526221 RepID=C9SWX5_VERA1|nr:conserved hypothetical protein [Verticillium alfalfae VaMs.102]EEY23516.1 conserved hypothetical protein [Verticillium alfalfae VaMs.102]